MVHVHFFEFTLDIPCEHTFRQRTAESPLWVLEKEDFNKNWWLEAQRNIPVVVDERPLEEEIAAFQMAYEAAPSIHQRQLSMLSELSNKLRLLRLFCLAALPLMPWHWSQCTDMICINQCYLEKKQLEDRRQGVVVKYKKNKS
ncbi:hypothetical protein CCR75_008423 [Bremia lactucae]|uniref:Uncharacterized protein n=1 Tax=Bremia lactucae TaxID=4779 RepID=A0A976FEK9_BRELC|nr:hypothetical protein CCR75_008423 [Bremia lactucae]